MTENTSPSSRSLEEQKTRLWAMSFESTKQIVHCEKCGATNIVNRLVEAPAALPTLRLDPASAPAQAKNCSAGESGQGKRAAVEQSKQLSREKKAILGLSALSAGLAIGLAASLLGKKRS